MEDRFLKKIQKTDTCWLWMAHTNRGYGQFRVGLKQCKAHRVAYELWVGPIPDGLLIRHKCDTPRCVNPAHLEIGTPKENSNDMVQRGRSYKVKGTAHPHSKLTEEDIVEIKILNEFDMSQKEIADILNVTQTTIGNTMKANNLKWNKISQSGTNNPNAKLSSQDIIEIHILRGFGFSQQQLADMYGVKQMAISRQLNKYI